jgi:hypothetical protein
VCIALRVFKVRLLPQQVNSHQAGENFSQLGLRIANARQLAPL